MDNRASIALLLTEMDAASPSGFVAALHVRSHAPMFLFQTYPVDWIDYYHKHGLVMKDPVMHWAFSNAGVVRWRDLSENDPHSVMADAKKYGLGYGFTVSIQGEKSRSLAGFARDDRDFLDVEINEIEILVNKLHRLTEGLEVLSEWDLNALKDMSVRMTRCF